MFHWFIWFPQSMHKNTSINRFCKNIMKTEDPKARILRSIFYGVFHRIQKSLFYIGVAIHDGYDTRRFYPR